MEIKARYVLIGLFVVAVIVGGFGFVYWLNNSGSLGKRTDYRIVFEGSVAGLLNGSEVLFNGITVGEVTRLSLVADDASKVVATIAVNDRTPVRGDTHVGLIFSGLTGVATVSLTGGSEGVSVAPASDGGAPILFADPGEMRDVTEAARDVLGRIDALISDNQAAFKSAIGNIDTFSSALAANSDKISGILEGLERLTGGKTETPPTTYDLTAAADFGTLGPVPPAQLVIEQPSGLITIDTQRINVRSPDGEQPAFPQARWADNVPLLVQARLIQSFENAKYLKVGSDQGGMNGDYKLSLAVQVFHVNTVPSPAVAEVTLSAKLMNADGNIVDAKVFSTTAPAPEAGTAAGAAAGLDAAFGKAAKEIVAWTIAAISADAAKAPAPAEPAAMPDLAPEPATP